MAEKKRCPAAKEGARDERQNGSVRCCDLSLSIFSQLSRACICGSDRYCLSLFPQKWKRNRKRLKPNREAFTAAHRTLPFGSKVKVTNKSNGLSVVVTINDRGPFVRGRVIDITPSAARALGFSGLTHVTVNGE
jgi:hypothetical protein